MAESPPTAKPQPPPGRLTPEDVRAAQRPSAASEKPSKPEPRPPARGPAINIEEGMTGLYETVGLLALMRGDQEAALVIIGEERLREIMSAEEVAAPGIAKEAGAAWSRLAQKNRSVHNTLTKLLEGSLFAEVLQAHAPLIALVIRRKPIKISALRKFRFFRRFNLNGKASPNVPQPQAPPQPQRPA